MKRMITPLLLAVALSSCTVRFDSHITIDADESGTFALEISLDEELRELAAQSGEADGFDLTGDLGDAPPGWSITEFAAGEFEGFRIATDFADFADLDLRLAELTASTDAGSPAPTFLEESGLTRSGNDFAFRTTITGLQDDLAGLSGGSDDLTFEGFDPSTVFAQLFQVRFIVTLPGKIGANNADSVDGNTLFWDIGFDDEGLTLHAASTAGAGGGGSTALALGLLVFAAVAIGVIVYRVSQRNRREEPVWMGHVATPLTPDPDGEVGADPFAATTPAASGPRNPAEG